MLLLGVGIGLAVIGLLLLFAAATTVPEGDWLPGNEVGALFAFLGMCYLVFAGACFLNLAGVPIG